MQLSDRIISFIKKSNVPESINSNFLITDLEKVIYAATFEENEYYMSKPLNIDLVSLINEWNTLPISEDLFFMENNSTKKVINNDKNKYSGLMVFPIYPKDKIEGLIIYFRNSGEYIKSSSKAPNTIRKWIMQYMGNSIFPIY